jgi:hypothetical protein
MTAAAPTLRNTRLFLVRLTVRATPFVPLINCATTEDRGSSFFRLTRRPRPPVALLGNTRKTECAAELFLVRLAVRAAPFAPLRQLRFWPPIPWVRFSDDSCSREGGHAA